MDGEDKKEPKPHYHGHRKRLRRRFLEGGSEALPDYELLELILFASNTRGDVKPLAKTLIERFGGFQRVLSAPPRKLAEIKGLKETGIVAIKAAQAAALRLARAEAMEQPVMSSWQKVLDYCRASMAYEENEAFRLLFLDRRNQLIADEEQQRGTIDHTPVYPREVVRRALELGAASIIMVHNHPSGDATPSSSDIDMTQAVKDAAEGLGISLHDHIIICRGDHSSMKGLGLI